MYLENVFTIHVFNVKYNIYILKCLMKKKDLALNNQQ